jgi:hypothetical protein
MAFAMCWEILWAQGLGFSLAAVAQVVVDVVVGWVFCRRRMRLFHH